MITNPSIYSIHINHILATANSKSLGSIEVESFRAGLTGAGAIGVLRSIKGGLLGFLVALRSKSIIILMNSSHCTSDSNVAYSSSH